MKVNVISGYFASAGLGLSVHEGYVDYFTSASDCDELIVLVQSDEWQRNKYGFNAIPVYRIIIGILHFIWSLQKHPKVTVLVNKEKTVANSLRDIRKRFPNDTIIFCKDGDRNIESLPFEEINAMKESVIDFKFFGNRKKASSKLLIA